MQFHLTAVFQQVPEGYIGFVEELPGANTQGKTLEETRANLQEAVALVWEANRLLAQEALHNHRRRSSRSFRVTAKLTIFWPEKSAVILR